MRRIRGSRSIGRYAITELSPRDAAHPMVDEDFGGLAV